MIAFKIGSEYLDLFPNSKIGVNLVSPLFSREIGFGSHSFRFDVPDTPKVRRLLGFKNLMSMPAQGNDQEAIIELGGNYWKTSTLKVVDAKPMAKRFSLAFTFDGARIKSQAEKILLKDLDLGGLRNTAVSETPEVIYQLLTVPINGNVSIEVNGQIFTEIMSGTGSETPNSVLDALRLQINAAISSVNAAVSTDQITITRTGAGDFWARYDVPGDDGVWSAIKDRSSFIIGRDDLLNHMATINGLPFGPYAFPTVKNTAFYSSPAITGFDGYINLYNPSTGAFVGNTSSDPYKSTMVPMVSVSYLLGQACAALGLTDVSTFTQSNDFKTIYLYSNISLDKEGAQLSFGGSPTDKVNWHEPAFDLKDHVDQEASIEDLFKAIAYYFNLAIEVDAIKQEISFIKRSVPAGTAKDWRGKTVANYSIGYKDAEPVKYSFEADDYDALFSEGRSFATVSPGGHKHELKVPFAPLWELRENHAFGSSWQITEIKQAGGTTLGDASPAEFTPRFFFFHGMQQDANGDLYPASSNTGTNYAGTNLTSFSLVLDGADGLYESHHKDFEPFLYPEKSGSHEFILSLLDVLEHKYDDAIRARIIEGDLEYLIKSLSFELEPGGAWPVRAQAEVYAKSE